ncbi:MAG: hypothetical protein E6R03_05735 [Hyphomicrobiaceae bacterium]|nr:MAG: hypothetical protein E6R03_05735 [Hyphomicrobiaceae bacterium]
MDSTAIDQWCHARRLIRLRGDRVDETMDYPVTLEIARTDPATGDDWFLAEIEVVAHIGPGAGGGWALEGWSYTGSVYHHERPHPRIESHTFKTRGMDPLDQAVEHRLKQHLYRSQIQVDEAWHFHKRERSRVFDTKAWVDHPLGIS